MALNLEKEKKLMIEQLRERYNITDKNILRAFEGVNRENFIPDEYKIYSYQDSPIPIGFNQTISQPYTIAYMLSLLEINKENMKILEVGSGSGYVLALLSHICKNCQIFGIEYVKELAEISKKNLQKEGIKDIKVFNKDGKEGLKEYSPFDRILISCAVKTEKDLENLFKQLNNNGILVAPIGQEESIMTKFIKQNNSIKKETFGKFYFVPMK